MNNKIMIGLVVVVGALAFFGGMTYAKGKSVPQDSRQARIGGAGSVFGGGRGTNPGGFTSGDILAKDTTSVTIKMRDGSSKIILIGGTTEIGKFVTGTVNDLEIGKTVTVMGKANTDGSITAQSIQIRENK